MAAHILSPHPLSTMSLDSDLALILELEDPLLMSRSRLEEVLDASMQAREPAVVTAYLHALLDQQRFGRRV